MRYRLIDVGFPYKKIMRGRHWVGRVYKHADGTWRGAINRQELGSGSTAEEAFSQCVARHLGFDSAAHLRQHNSGVRRDNRARREQIRHTMNRVLQGGAGQERWNALDELLTHLVEGRQR